MSTTFKRLSPKLLTLVTAIAAPSLHAALVTLPNSAATTEGSSVLATAVQTTPRTLQLQVAASQLGGIPVGSVLESISFRQDGGGSAAPAGSYSYSQYKITLAEAANSIASMSMTFADNMVDPVSVFDGPLTIAASSYPGGTTPNPWGASITFETPYTYQGGDLVVLISHPASSAGTAVDLDAVGEASTEYRSIRNQTTFDAATAGITDNVFTVFRVGFTAAAVPEPMETALLTGVGLLGFLGWRRARR